MNETSRLLQSRDGLSEAEILASHRHRPFLRTDAPPGLCTVIYSLPALLLLAPLRIVSFFVLLALGYVLVCFTRCFGPSVSLAASASDNGRASRLHAFRSTLAVLCRVFLFISGLYYIDVVNHGKQEDDELLNSAVVVSNHLSFIDILVLESHFKLPGFVAKASAAKTPLFGPFFSYTNCLMVHREEGDAKEAHREGETGPKRSVTEQLVERQKDFDLAFKAHVADGGMPCDFHVAPLVVFPEGTTTNGKQILAFRTGAFVSGLPVQAVGIEYPASHFSMSWETIPVLWYLFRMLTQYRIKCRLHLLPMQVPSEAERDDASLYASTVASSIASVLQVPVISAGYTEKREVHKAVLAGRLAWHTRCPS